MTLVGASSFVLFDRPFGRAGPGELWWDPTLTLLDWTVRWPFNADDPTSFRSLASGATWFRDDQGCNVEATWWAVLPATTEELQLDPEPELRRLCAWPEVDVAERERLRALVASCDALSPQSRR